MPGRSSSRREDGIASDSTDIDQAHRVVANGNGGGFGSGIRDFNLTGTEPGVRNVRF
ncbi:hypothetical protein [Streptomyces sp. NPDC127112]|uniref:hypothetical protein n=1 Tax=Streptomyces sp. NPDC127112 TaxID=3345364 RepID=UPI00362C4E8F